MIEEEICRKIVNLGKPEMMTVVYSLTVEERSEYSGFGVSVRIPERNDYACVRDITTYRGEAERLIDIMATGFVTPVSVMDIVEDWLGR